MINKQMVEKAIGLLKPVIATLMAQYEKKGAYIVVITDNYGKKKKLKEHILWEGAIEDGLEYKDIATAKAAVSWRTGTTSNHIASVYPWLLKPGDCVWEGGVAESVGGKTIVVAISGLKGFHDQGVAAMIVETIKMLCAEAVSQITETDSGTVK